MLEKTDRYLSEKNVKYTLVNKKLRVNEIITALVFLYLGVSR